MQSRQLSNGSRTPKKMAIFGTLLGRAKPWLSFKTAQILTNLPQVHKILFVSDRPKPQILLKPIPKLILVEHKQVNIS